MPQQTHCTHLAAAKIAVVITGIVVIALTIWQSMFLQWSFGNSLPTKVLKLYKPARQDDSMTSGSKPTTTECKIVPSNLTRVAVDTGVTSWKTVDSGNHGLALGGRYKPIDCVARSRVAVIIPYRDREAHLKTLLRHIHPFMQRQRLEYGVYVVELKDGVSFNRALLMNIGFVEANKVYPYDCFIFHDVDLIPEDYRNQYSCTDRPKHLSTAIDTHTYQMPYASYFGGAGAISKDQFLKINGFSNLYYGWGGEDDDLHDRNVLTQAVMAVTIGTMVYVGYYCLFYIHSADCFGTMVYFGYYSLFHIHSADGVWTIDYACCFLSRIRCFCWFKRVLFKQTKTIVL